MGTLGDCPPMQEGAPSPALGWRDPGPHRGLRAPLSLPRAGAASSPTEPAAGSPSQAHCRHLPGGAAHAGGSTSSPASYYASFMGRNFFLCCLVSC